MSLYDKAADVLAFGWDIGLYLLNFVTPKYEPGQVVPKGSPGHNLTWPEYVPPKEGDSRSPCPMLNAMANHGILPHDGKNITFKEFVSQCAKTPWGSFKTHANPFAFL